MRNNEVQKTGEVIKQIINLNTATVLDKSTRKPMQRFTKQQLWKEFKCEFKNSYGKEFINSPTSLKNIKTLFLYFLGDPEFFECENLKTDLSRPSFKKGLLIVGGVGIGKTAYMKIFEKIFSKYPGLRFKGYHAKDLVNLYESCAKPSDKSYMMNTFVRQRLFIDDINSERIASNYGNCNVVEEILFSQYEKGNKTFATTNHTNAENDMVKTLIDLGQVYGSRMYDRFFEMFNIIDFTGKSNRR
ncbi:hypothetical protein [Algibacter sp. L3A6]|uniref:hypothetical protein n=1 Tax=Algibacter sp. L3A6 TaxID=2686366 RepID=UPI00131D3D1E|nr:hypothetical protein [Algibacter sp. L3A6]